MAQELSRPSLAWWGLVIKSRNKSQCQGCFVFLNEFKIIEIITQNGETKSFHIFLIFVGYCWFFICLFHLIYPTLTVLTVYVFHIFKFCSCHKIFSNIYCIMFIYTFYHSCWKILNIIGNAEHSAPFVCYIFWR